MSLKEKLLFIQVNLKAPKNLYNSFGNYNYRNAEGILNAVKPYLDDNKVSLTLSDCMECIGDRIYVKATATLHDCESEESISVTAYAREAGFKKGMDDSQITGTASSYARKYSLNGLFLLDDEKDADSDEYKKQVERQTEEQAFNERVEKEGHELASQAQKNCIFAICKKHGVDVKELYSSNNLDEKKLTKNDATNVIRNLKKKYGDD